MGVPSTIANILKKLRFGIGTIYETVNQTGSYFTISSAIKTGKLVLASAVEHYHVGYQRVTSYDFSLCGVWLQDHSCVGMEAHLTKKKMGVNISLPRSYRLIDGDQTILMCE